VFVTRFGYTMTTTDWPKVEYNNNDSINVHVTATYNTKVKRLTANTGMRSASFSTPTQCTTYATSLLNDVTLLDDTCLAPGSQNSSIHVHGMTTSIWTYYTPTQCITYGMLSFITLLNDTCLAYGSTPNDYI